MEISLVYIQLIFTMLCPLAEEQCGYILKTLPLIFYLYSLKRKQRQITIFIIIRTHSWQESSKKYRSSD